MCVKACATHSSFSHLIAGDGSPTALQGSTISLIHGVVTVRLKVRTRAGAAKNEIDFIQETASQQGLRRKIQPSIL